MVITSRPRQNAVGVEVVTWDDVAGQSGRCVVAHLDVADECWRQLADVVLCRDTGLALATLPGSMVAAATLGPYHLVAVRAGGEFLVRASGIPLSIVAAWCYASAASRSRTCCACGSRDRS